MATNRTRTSEAGAGSAETPQELDYSADAIQAFVNAKGPYRVSAHWHRHFELLYLTRGCRNFFLGKKYRARSGDLIVFRPGEAHQEFSGSKTISYIVLRFQPGHLAQAGLEFPSPEMLGPVLHLGERKRFLELFARMVDEKRQPRDSSQLLLGAYLVEFVVLLRRAVRELALNDAGEEEGRDRVYTAIELIQENLTRPLRLAELARGAFMSSSHFSHVFKEAVGRSPRNFQVQERIEKAKELLAGSEQPAREIAALLGYDEPYFFYRQFKKKTGLTAMEIAGACAELQESPYRNADSAIFPLRQTAK